MIILLYRVVLISNVISILSFILYYSKKAPWWNNSIGRTIVAKDMLLLLASVPPVLSLFFSFNRLTSQVAAWVDLVFLGLIAPVMVWRILVFRKASKKDRD